MNKCHVPFIETRVLAMAQIEQVKWSYVSDEHVRVCVQRPRHTCIYVFPVFQIKFEHFSFGLTVKRNQNASKRRGHGGCPQGHPRPDSQPPHPPHAHRRSRTTLSTAEPQQPRVVTQKVNAGAGGGGGRGVGCFGVRGGAHALPERLGHGSDGR